MNKLSKASVFMASAVFPFLTTGCVTREAGSFEAFVTNALLDSLWIICAIAGLLVSLGVIVLVKKRKTEKSASDNSIDLERI